MLCTTVSLSCVKRLGELWFDPKFSHERFSISCFVEIVDHRIYSIKLPSHVAR